MPKIIGPANPVYAPEGVGGGGVILGKGPAEPIYIVDATGQIFDISGMYDEIQKIDLAASLGLSGVEDSISYRAAEIDRHVHHYSRVLGLAAIPNGELHRADEQTSDPDPFVVTAGNDDWGPWMQLLGSLDTPQITGCVKFDPHLVSIVAVQTANTIYQLQLAVGTSGAAALAAGTYSGKTFTPQSVNGRPAPVPFGLRRQDVGTNIWMRSLARGANAPTLSLYLEIHEYEG